MIAAISPELLIGLGILLLIAVAAFLIISRSGKQGPDIPPAFQPGPSDAELEKPRLEKLQAWGIVVLALTALWLPAYWLGEANANVAREEEFLKQAIDHGAHEVQLFDEHSNPAGIGCVQCHGTDLKGQEVMQGESVFLAANLTTVCERLTQEEIREVIKQGREPNMPAWGVEYNGALNDQQVDSIVSYLSDASNDTVDFAKNKCMNPDAANPPEAESPAADGATTDGGDAAATDASPSDASPTPAE